MEHRLPVTLHHEQHGDPSAPPVLLLGSLGSDLSMWQPQIDALSANWNLITVDHRGHGSSPAPRGPYSMSDLGGDIVALLDSLELQSVHYVGLSLGGAVGQWLAAHHPARVRTLTLLCTSPAFLPAGPWIDRAATVRTEGLASIAESIVSRWFSSGRAASDPSLIGRHVEMVENTTDEGYAACCEAISDWDGRGDLAGIAAPTLVIAGDEDPATPPAAMRILADGITDAEFHVVAPGAHLANVEQPEVISHLIADHLAKSRS